MLTLTESATKAIYKFINSSETPEGGLRISVSGGGCSGMQYALALEAIAEDTDTIVECGDVKVFIDPQSAPMMEGITVDFVEGLEGTGFKFHNPNATASCGCGNSFSV